jgi:hypothetical protein
MNRISPSAAPAIRDFRIHLSWLPHRFATLFGLKDGTRAKERPTTHRLVRGQVLSITNPYGLQFTCTAGALWLTVLGEPKDIILKEGESFRCAARAHLCATAFGPSSLHIARTA